MNVSLTGKGSYEEQSLKASGLLGWEKERIVREKVFREQAVKE
jgi:hypothetical protein